MEEQKRSFIQQIGDKILNRDVTHLIRTEDVKPSSPTPAQIAWAIRQNETRGVKGDPYAFSRSSGSKAQGKALGAYQATEGELKSYAPRFLGSKVDSKTFLSTPSSQDKYIENKIKYYADQGYTPSQIADIHRSGFTKSGVPGSTTYQNQKYVDSFEKFLKATTTPATQVSR